MRMVSEMEFRILKKFEQLEPYINQVNTIADRNTHVLGFLPKSAYREQALQGKLWICIDTENQYTGHLMFGGKTLSLYVAQLYVDESYRQHGIATRLMQELEAYGSMHNCLSIKARVAADLPANRFWEKQGYRIARQEDGGKTTKRRINIRAKDLDVPSLLDLASLPTETMQTDLVVAAASALETYTYAIDVNVVLDLTKERKNVDTIRRLFGFSLYGKGQVCVTVEFVRELEKHSANFAKDPLLAFAKALPTLPRVSADILKPIVEKLAPLVFPDRYRNHQLKDNDFSDLGHIAQCIHHEVTGFITSDGKILRAQEELYKLFKLQVLSPDEVVNSTASSSDAISKKLCVSHEGENLTSEAFDEKDRKSVEIFLELQGFSSFERRKILAPGVVGRERTRLVAWYNDHVVGFASWGGEENGSYQILYLIVDEEERFAQNLIDHFLYKITTDLQEGKLTLIALSIPIGSDLSRKAALDRGFRKNANLAVGIGECDLVKMSYRGYVTPYNWNDFSECVSATVDLKLPNRMPTVAEFSHTGIVLTGKSVQGVVPVLLEEAETLFSPAVFLCEGREALIVPIKKHYIEMLLDAPMRQLNLLPENEALFHVEKAYFKSKRNSQLITPGQLIFFYVSGSEGDKAVIGHGRVTSSRVMEVESAILKLKRQGALDEAGLREIADADGNIHAITFDNIKFIESPVPFSFLKQNNYISGANLITAEKISYQALTAIIKEGSKNE